VKVEIRVHGPYRHRKQWRLDVFDNGERSKQTFTTYKEALLAAHAILTGAETRTEFRVSVSENGKSQSC
jgi:hypothetical protein